MKKASLVLAASLALIGATSLGAHASAGNVGNRSVFLEQTMGLRLIQTSTFDTAQKTLKAQVVDADRFASRGFPGAKANDDVVIVVLGDKRGKVKHMKSGKAHIFKVKDDGTVERE
jgi:hypothetical protein